MIRSLFRGIGHASIAMLLACNTAPAADAPPAASVDLVTLSGSTHSGRLMELGADRAVVKVGDRDQAVPLSEVLEIRTSKATETGDPKRPELALVDGTRLFFSRYVATGRDASIDTPRFGSIKTAATTVANVRFAALEPALAASWKGLVTRVVKLDMLIVRKGDVLDHVDGTVGNIDETSIHFVLDGEDVPVKREKVFGIVFARRPVEGKPLCEVAAASGDLLRTSAVRWEKDRFELKLVAGAAMSIPSADVRALDFSLGKVKYLSQLDPRDVQYTPYFDQVWEYHRDRRRDGGQLRVGNKEYARGLWIHSKTVLKYRLNGDYRRFQSVMGIDQAVAPLGNVRVVIKGDDKSLLEKDVRGSDPPQNLDLDVAGVRELEILVDFGGDLDIADHLALCDAKVIK